MHIKSIKCIEIIKGLSLFIIYTFFHIIFYAYNCLDSGYKYFAIFAYIQILYVFNSWHKITNTKFDAYLLFSIALYLFNVGHLFLIPFNGVTEKFSFVDSWDITKATLFRVEYIVLSFLLAFHIGAIFAVKKKDVQFCQSLTRIGQLESIKKVGWLGVFVSMPFYISVTIKKLLIVAIYGYLGLYTNDNSNLEINSFSRILSDLFEPSVLCLVFYYENIKKHRLVTYSLSFLITCLPAFFFGARTGAVIMLGLMFLIYYISNKGEIPFKRIIIYAVSAYMILVLLVLVRNTRLYSNDSNNNFEISSELQKTIQEEKIIPSVISEMGWSMYATIKTIEMLNNPNENLRYGSSFLWSFTTLIPNFFWETHPAQEHANMSNWITKKLNFNYGIGFSIIAESYVNFGRAGFIFMFFFGILICTTLRPVNPLLYDNNYIRTMVSIIFLWFIILIVRNNFMDTIRYVGYYVFPIYLSLRLFEKH